MSYLICDFMGDDALKKLAEKIVSKDLTNFKFLMSHSLPGNDSNLSKLEHLDANLLYSTESLYKLDKNIAFPSVGAKKNADYQECLQTFLTCFDRIDPLGLSCRERVNYFWVLLGFYEKYFNERPEINSIIFCNVPHMPWDILLFYFAKSFNIKTLFLRKTGFAGYIYIDEDYRPYESRMVYDYLDVTTLKDIDNINHIDIVKIQGMNFTNGQVEGSWNKRIPFIKKNVKKLSNTLRLNNFFTSIRVFFSGKPSISKRATISSKQVSTFSAYNNFSWLEFISTHFKHLSNLKKIKDYYNEICLNEIPEKSFIYVSLHLQPERSTNPEGGHFDNQALMIQLISKCLPEDWCIIIKEHPKQFKYDLRTFHSRRDSFYSGISRLDNAYFINQDFSQDDLIKKSQITATVSGSVGWESLLNKIPVLLFSDNWHSQCNASRYVYDEISIKKAIEAYSNMTSISIEEDVINFAIKISPSLIFGSLNSNHELFFVPKGEEDSTRNNVANAILQRLVN